MEDFSRKGATAQRKTQSRFNCFLCVFRCAVAPLRENRYSFPLAYHPILCRDFAAFHHRKEIVFDCHLERASEF
jgi:hypothetical protein